MSETQEARCWTVDDCFSASVPDVSPVTQKVIEHIGEAFGVDPSQVQPDASLWSLAADNLDRIDLMMRLEVEFGIEITMLDDDGLSTCGDVVTLVKRPIQAKVDF